MPVQGWWVLLGGDVRCQPPPAPWQQDLVQQDASCWAAGRAYSKQTGASQANLPEKTPAGQRAPCDGRGGGSAGSGPSPGASPTRVFAPLPRLPPRRAIQQAGMLRPGPCRWGAAGHEVAPRPCCGLSPVPCPLSHPLSPVLCLLSPAEPGGSRGEAAGAGGIAPESAATPSPGAVVSQVGRGHLPGSPLWVLPGLGLWKGHVGGVCAPIAPSRGKTGLGGGTAETPKLPTIVMGTKCFCRMRRAGCHRDHRAALCFHPGN